MQNGSCEANQRSTAKQTTVNGKRISRKLILIPGETSVERSCAKAQGDRLISADETF